MQSVSSNDKKNKKKTQIKWKGGGNKTHKKKKERSEKKKEEGRAKKTQESIFHVPCLVCLPKMMRRRREQIRRVREISCDSST